MTTRRTVIIVGGVAGGMSAATRLRRNDENARILVFERGEHVSFANCGLPYVIGGVISDREAVLLQTPQGLRDRFEIEVKTRHEVLAVHTETREVVVRNLADGSTWREEYDELVLSPGAHPMIPPIPGVERAMTLRDVADLDAISAAVDSAHDAVVIGGGFIGLEMAENLVRRGLKVSVIEAADQLMAPLDPELAILVQDELERHGVAVHLSSQVEEIAERDVVLRGGQLIRGDLVVMAIGVEPESSLAAAAGLELGPRGAIMVDAHQRTSAPNVFAVGDAVVKRDELGTDVLVPLANTANRQGRLVADVISCRVSPSLRATRGTAILGIFDLVVAVSGESEKRAMARGLAPRVIHTHPSDHAGYFPGAEGMSLKLVIDPVTDRILGIQGVGGAGVDKRIDVVATAMAGGLSASDLADLELAYAPQFGSAKDPINMLGFVAENLRNGEMTIQWHELERAMRQGVPVVDVRSREERTTEQIPGSIGIPLDELRDRLDEIPAGEVIVHCAVGQRGHTAARLLEQHGRTVSNLDGGMCTWSAGVRCSSAITNASRPGEPVNDDEGDADAA